MATGKTFVRFHDALVKKTIDWPNDAIKIALYTSALVPDQNANSDWLLTPYTANEVVGAGYTAGGQALTVKTATPTTLKYVLSAANPSWTGASFTTAFAVIYDSTPATPKPLISYIDFGGNQTVTAGTFTITVDATNGIAFWTVS